MQVTWTAEDVFNRAQNSLQRVHDHDGKEVGKLYRTPHTMAYCLVIDGALQHDEFLTGEAMAEWLTGARYT